VTVKYMRIFVLIAALSAWIIPATQANAAFPGANGRIAFSTDFSQPSQIYTSRPNGTDVRQLTHYVRGHGASNPDISPDGEQIVFTHHNQIWVMDADGSNPLQLTLDPDRVSQTPSWSPDGTSIVFSRCSFPFGAQRCSIDVMNADGSGVTKLIGGDWRSQSPEYSPDGQTIAFASNRGGYVSNIWVIGSDGSDLDRLTEPKLQAWAPDWSPDGSRILFTSDSDLPFPSVFVMSSGGTDLHELTHFTDDYSGGFARYSPDGRKIVLVSDLAHSDHCCTDLYVMNANGSNLHAILTSQPAVFATDWGPAVTP
jgi:Tol biopolymer transport system component